MVHDNRFGRYGAYLYYIYLLFICVKLFLRILILSTYIHFNSSETTNSSFDLDIQTFEKKVHEHNKKSSKKGWSSFEIKSLYRYKILLK